MSVPISMIRAALAFSLLLAGCGDDGAQMQQLPTNPFMQTDMGRTLVVAHRGGRSLFPENTLTAFDGAVQMGVDVLELDVCLTKDDVLVTIHDVTIDRTCEGSGAVLDYTFAELQQFNFGYHFQAADGSYPFRDDPVRIPRLEDVFATHNGTLMIIEIKNPGATGKRAAKILHDIALDFNMQEKVVVFSFADDVMGHFRRINTGELYTGGSVSDALAFILLALDGNEVNFRRQVDVFSFPTELEGLDLVSGSEQIIRAAKNTGIAIHFWTINNKDEMTSLLEKGVDGIITDKPDLLQEALDEL